jgi:ParB-like chromosome segregation protein Spo0J
MKNLKIEYIDINDLVLAKHNSRTHSAQQINQIADSIKEFGWTNPVLIDENNEIIAGHGRVLAAELMALDRIPCVRLKGLTKAQKKAYLIADNQLPLNAGWDLDQLKVEIGELKELDFDINLLGFDDEFLRELDENLNFDPSDKDSQGDLENLSPVYVVCPKCGHEFDSKA